MIGALRGTITTVSEQTILLVTGGVGYEVVVPHPGQFSTGDTIELHTYLAVRETALDLYGFLGGADKQLFVSLLSVPKIGPKSALDIMRKADAALLQECIAADDPSRLHKLSGIGKKTCENIVNHLKDKVVALPTAADAPDPHLSTTQADAIDALISLGYDPKTARTAILALPADEQSVSDLVATALRSGQLGV